ncbi:non-hydrolyzing UDP-N-acetylglucosamine 2-epimerase [Chryseobacterium sp. T1]
MKTILIVFGTRPEAIKMAPLVKKLEQYKEQFKVSVCVTAQHRQMLDQVLRLFEIVPDYDLNIMKEGQDLYDVTSIVLVKMREVLTQIKPDIVLVHGDTTTSMAVALASFYQKIPVGHIEAGLRTHNIYSPWPEEVNRQLTGRIATYHFAPTQLSCQNLLDEKVKESNIIITGNTVIDALHWVVDKIDNNQKMSTEIGDMLISLGYDYLRLDDNKRVVLITGHRRENFGEGFLNICKALKELTKLYPSVDFIYPMHLNPNVRKPINDIFGSEKPDNIFFIEPLDYLPFIFLMKKSFLVLTDSGGIQEEAPGLGKPVLVMRENTERPEAVEAGTVQLVGTQYDRIVEGVCLLLDNENHYNAMARASNPYGDGKASDKIIQFLINKLNN